MGTPAPTLIRRFPNAFVNPTSLERFVPGLGFASEPVRRYTALSTKVATGDPVMEVPNIGRLGTGEVLTPLTASAAPTLGDEAGTPFLRFDGTDDRMYRGVTADAFNADEPTTIYGVVRVRAYPAASGPMFGWGETTSAGVRVSPTGVLGAHRGTAVSTGLTIPTVGFHVIVFTASGPTSVVRLDATEVTVSPGYTSLATYPLGIAGGLTAIDVYEIGAFSGTFNGTQRTQLVAALNDIYNL